MKKHNRRYKDSVFVDLFGEDKDAKENFLSLYNALHGTHLDSSTELKPLRLDNVMYMSFCNDVSCLIDNKIIVLAEHQSTVNANMPVRFLEYVSRLYEQIQLVVKVLNINYNKDNGLLERCKPLEEYTLFVEAVRRHIRLDAENGFKNAIKECIRNDILRDYLERKSREVMNMLVAEYDYDTDIAVQREEEREIAFADGSHQAKLETARILKRLGDSIQKIMQATSLTQEEVENLN